MNRERDEQIKSLNDRIKKLEKKVEALSIKLTGALSSLKR